MMGFAALNPSYALHRSAIGGIRFATPALLAVSCRFLAMGFATLNPSYGLAGQS